jgi:DNA-binding PadR family transcriptional regulator
MRSPVNWALLGLVIERPSYAYALAQRFERTYRGVLSLSSISHAYQALATLKSRALIEEISGTRVGRQPRPQYRATRSGMEAYQEWLVSQVHEDRRRQRLLVMELAALMSDPEAGLEFMARCKRACHEAALELPMPSSDGARIDSASDFVLRLLSEESYSAPQTKRSSAEHGARELRPT